MLHLFRKKRFLADALENFVDIHNHILPGIDDGAKDTDESIAILKGFADIGISKFIATPHIMHNFYPNTPETIRGAHGLLLEALPENQWDDLRLDLAAEYMIDDNFENLLEQDQVLPLGQDYLLMEMSYLQPPINLEEALVKAVRKGLYPILAHPERYTFYHNNPRRYSQLKGQGILFQLNMLSLSDFYSQESPKVAYKLLEDGLFDYIASDVHNMEQLNALKEITISRKALDQLFPVIQKTIETFY